jgi:CheY-like chemotaxis protein
LLEQALEGVARVRATVRGLRTFARADEERRRPTDLRRVLDVAADLAGNEVRHRATLVKDYGAAPCVDADEGRMAQVFVNLIVNASQAMPDGEGANRRIKLRLRGDDRQAFVEIEDEGCGMSPEVLARAFEPFFTTKPVGVGSGLGLSICHGIVSAHGGSIELRSAPGRGTVVRIGLPRSRAASPVDVAPAREERATPYANEGDAASLAAHPNRGAAPSRDPAAEEARRPYVLVVDDDPLVARATARILARECETLVVGSGAEALAAIANRAPDVVLCDLMMPEMTGMELYARLRAERPAAAERMVFMTGGAFTASARDFLDRTPHPRVEKPFLPGELRAVVARTAARAGRAPTPAAIP